MNNNNNQFNANMNKNMNGFPMNAMMNGPRTNSAVKFMIVLLLGILPLLLCSLLITDSSMTEEFKQWGQTGPKNAIWDIDYGFMWLIGIAVYISIFPIVGLLTKITKEVKLDVIPLTSAAGLAMLNMFVIPHTSAWFLLLSIPAFSLIGAIIGLVVMVVMIVKQLNKQLTTMQEDPKFKEMMDQLQGLQGAQGPQAGRQPNGGPKQSQKKFEDNPFVDIPEEDEEK